MLPTLCQSALHKLDQNLTITLFICTANDKPNHNHSLAIVLNLAKRRSAFRIL